MSINNKVVTAGTVVNSTSLFAVPAGPATLLLSASGGTVLVGSGTNVSTGNGFPVVAGNGQPLSIPVYAGQPGSTWSAVVASGSASLYVMISQPSGGIGTGTLG